MYTSINSKQAFELAVFIVLIFNLKLMRCRIAATVGYYIASSSIIATT